MTQENRTQTFATPAPIRLRVDIPKGRIRVLAEEISETHIELSARPGDHDARALIADAEIAQHDDLISVRIERRFRAFDWRSAIEAIVRVPLGSAVKLSIGSGSIETIGQLADVDAASGSGAVRIDRCEEANAQAGSGAILVAAVTNSIEARTGSGEIIVGTVGANARLTTGSGRVELARAIGDAIVSTASGKIEIGEAGDSVDAHATSGSVKIERADHGRVRVRAMSGHVSVGIAHGTAALLDVTTMSGRVHSDLESAAAPSESDKRLELHIKSMSGNVSLTRARDQTPALTP